MIMQEGGQVSLYANGQQLATVVVNPVASGYLGLYAESWQANLDARFDNFRVYEPGSAGLNGGWSQLQMGRVSQGRRYR